MFLSKFNYIWLIVSATIVIWDASYVLLRPHSLKGGIYEQYYAPYQIYIKYDTLYAGNNDLFVVIQSWLNVAEILLSYLAVILSMRSCVGSKAKGAIVAVVASAFTFWKTVIYLWYVHPHLTPEAKVVTADSLMYFIIPSSFWIICPFLTLVGVSGRICKALAPKAKKAWNMICMSS